MGAFENLLVDDFRCDSYSYVTASDFPFSPISAEQIHIQINCNILQQSVTKVPTCQFFGHLGLYRPAFLADSYMISQDLASSAIFHFNPDLGYSGITFLHHFCWAFCRKIHPGGVIPFADCAIQLADEMNARLRIRHNSPRTSALRRDKYLQQAGISGERTGS